MRLAIVVLVLVSVIAAAFCLLPLRNAPAAHTSRWFLSRPGDHKPLVMAHQGGEGEWPSNTLIAFRNAARAGADVLDTDMHMTKDGVLVLIHDSTVDRTTNGKGEVGKLTLSQIKKFDAAYNFTKEDGRTFPYRGQGVTIPTVEEMFGEFPHTRMGIEIKDHDAITAQRFCVLIRKYKMQDNVLVSSFGQQAMDAFRAECPEVSTSATTDEVRHFLTLNLFGFTNSFSPHYSSFQIPETVGRRQIITSHLLISARERNLPVLPWTVNEESDMRHLIAMGVYAINTDYPSRMIRILREK